MADVGVGDGAAVEGGGYCGGDALSEIGGKVDGGGNEEGAWRYVAGAAFLGGGVGAGAAYDRHITLSSVVDTGLEGAGLAPGSVMGTAGRGGESAAKLGGEAGGGGVESGAGSGVDVGVKAGAGND